MAALCAASMLGTPAAAQEVGASGVRAAASAVAASPTLTLEQAVRTALDRNRLLVDARYGLEGAKARVREAWGSVMPTMDLTASYTRNLSVPANFLPAAIFDPTAGEDDFIAVRFGADNAWALQIRAEQPLFQAGVFLGVGAAERYRQLQTEMVRGKAQEVATRVRTVYYDVLLAEEALRVSEKSLARVEQMLGETRAMFNAGLASEYDVLRFEVEKSNLEPSRRRAANAAAAARRTLAIELGLDGDAALQLEGPLTGVDIDLLADGYRAAGVANGLLAAGPRAAGVANGLLAAGSRAAGVVQVAHASVPSSSNADLVQQALSERSDLRQLGLTRELRRTELRAEQAEYLPKVSLFGTYMINAQGNGAPHFFGDSPNQRAYGRQVGVQVTMPLFAGFKRPARVSQKRAELHRVETQASLTRAQAEHEVETLAAQYSEALERAQAQKAAVRQAQRGFDIASAQYREGLSGRLEVTDAELALRQSEFNYAQAVYDYLVSQAQLDRATGAVPFVDNGARTPLTTAGIP